MSARLMTARDEYQNNSQKICRKASGPDAMVGSRVAEAGKPAWTAGRAARDLAGREREEQHP
jgi:hypothetical protein